MGTFNNDLGMSRTALGDDKKKKKELPSWTKQESGTVANVFQSLNKSQKDITNIDKQNRPKGDTTPKKNSQNVLGQLNKKSTTYKISQNPADYTNQEKLKVNKDNQKRVNKILGR